MTREIVLDTETTGFNPFNGDRIIEIGAVELLNHLPTGRTCQIYIHPERDVPQEAIAIHGITNKFLVDKPKFSQCYMEFMEFIAEDSTLIIHNAEFDMKFLNWELENIGHKPIAWNRVIDTLTMARKKFPGSPASLDALCRRYNIDNTSRTYHGALLDSELLADVYLELIGGRQRWLELTDNSKIVTSQNIQISPKTKRKFREPNPQSPSAEELEAHKEFLAQIKDPIWNKV